MTRFLYRGWWIADGDWLPWEYWHDSYDGAPDSGDTRYGGAATIEEAIAAIDEREDGA